VDINLTLFGQMLTFIVFVWFTMKFVWPPIMKIMEERRSQIASGLAASEQGHRDLELAQHKKDELLNDAKAKAAAIIESAERRGNKMIEDAKSNARDESAKMLENGKTSAANEMRAARENLRKEFSGLIVAGAEKLAAKNIDAASNQKLIDDLIEEL
jgi:F-type H+-transporting ATPase subunit b